MKSFLLSELLLLTLGAAAQPAAPIRVVPPVREVTLYTNSAAELRHEARPTLPAGTQTVRLTGLALGLDPATLRATVGSEAELLSTETVAADPTTAPRDSAGRLWAAYYRARATAVAATEEKNLLIANREVRGTTAATWNADVGRVAAAFRERMTDVQMRVEVAEAEHQRLQVLVARLPRTTEPTSTGRDVLLRLRVRTAGPVTLSLRYRATFSGNSWVPELTLRANRLTEPLRAESAARISNFTGLPWNAVRLTLVSAPATQYVRRPNLQPWSARLTDPDDNDRYSDDDDESVGEGRLDDFAVKGTAPAHTGTSPAAADSLAVGAETISLSDRFRLPGRPTIPADAREFPVPIETLDLPLRAEHYAVPKLDADVFLIGKVTALQRLRAPATSAAVYLSGNYVGTTELNTRAYNDTVEVALGVDPQVVVSRTKRADNTSRRLLGGKQKVALGYEINLRNNRPTSVRLRVADQIPVALDREISIELTEKSGATHDAESGRLTWVVDLRAGESRRLPFAFTVEAPEGKTLSLDKRERRVRSPKFR